MGEHPKLDELRHTHSVVRPICEACYVGGRKPATRIPLK